MKNNFETNYIMEVDDIIKKDGKKYEVTFKEIIEKNSNDEFTTNEQCKGCKYENCDGSIKDIGNCVICNRINDLAKYDQYKPIK